MQEWSTKSQCKKKMPFLFWKQIENLQVHFYCNLNYLKNKSDKAMSKWRNVCNQFSFEYKVKYSLYQISVISLQFNLIILALIFNNP